MFTSSNGYLFDLPGEYLRPALMVSLLSVWVLVGLFVYLNAYTKRRYFTIWSAAWLFYALWLTLSLGLQEWGPSPLLVMMKQWCVGTAAVFMIWGASICLKQAAPERIYAGLIVFLLLWSYWGAYQDETNWWSQLAVFTTIGAGSGLTAYSFFRFRRERPYLGASLLSTGFLLWGGYLASFPLWESSEQLISAGFFISAVLQLFIAVSMIIFVLEESRTFSEQALQQIAQQKSEQDGLRTQMLFTEERYRLLFAHASEPIVIAAAENLRLLELNQAARRLLGLRSSESGPALLTSHLRFNAALGPAPATGPEWFAALTEHGRVDVVRPDGSCVPVEVAGSAVVLEGVTAYQFFLREVTERARLEQQLRQAEKLSALGQMISGVAHELNNPLAVIKGYLDLILLRHHLEPQTRADLKKVVHESNRAAKLVSNFLSFAREPAVEREAVCLNQLIERIFELREMELRVIGAEAELHLDPGLPWTMVDASQIEQVLVNLVTNAIHALAEWPKARCLRIYSQLRGQLIVLQVEDSGPGIAKEILPHIFEPFFTTKPVGTGTGLGLSIAYSIVTEHGGRIYYRPASEGGAGFVIELPLVKPEGELEEESAGPEGEEQDGLTPDPTGARVLVVDDEPVLGELLSELLLSLGHSAVTCTSAVEALELLAAQPFDAILSDYRMPRMNGREFYERVHARDPEMAKRIVFVTGDVINQETRAFLEAIGNAHLAKPFRPEGIAAVVREVLAGRTGERAEPEPAAVG